MAVVTGGTGALGRWVVRRFVDEGATVHVPWIEEEEAKGLMAVLGDTGRLKLDQADLTDPGSVERYFGQVRAEAGAPTILANIAGGFHFAPLEDTEPRTWDHMWGVNATSAFLCCRAVVPGMRALEFGRVINVAAVPAIRGGGANMTAYGASKAAVLNFTMSLAQELEGSGVTANALVPTIIDTPANRAAMPKADRGGWLSGEKIAAVVSFLCTEDARIITGSAIQLAAG